MKADWTPTVGGAVTLGDDSASRPIELGSLSAASAQQVEPLFRGANPARFARGNVSGECVFTVAQSHASKAAATTFFKAELARVNQKGTLVLTESGVPITMAGAVLGGVALAGTVGLRWWIRYSFGIGSVA